MRNIILCAVLGLMGSVLLADEEGAAPESAVTAKESNESTLALAKALYLTKLETFNVAVGTSVETAAKLIVEKVEAQGIPLEIKWIGGTKEQPHILTINEVALDKCTCVEALESLAIAAECGYQVLRDVVLFIHNGKRTENKQYDFEREFITSEGSGFVKREGHWIGDGEALGIPLEEGCSLSYSMFNEKLTVRHRPQMQPRIRKILKEKYWTWQKEHGKKRKVTAAMAVKEKLGIILMPTVLGLNECSLGEGVELLNIVLSDSRIKLELHKDISPDELLTLKDIAGDSSFSVAYVLRAICADIGANYKVRKNKIILFAMDGGTQVRQYRISAKQFAEMMPGYEVTTAEGLKEALRDLGVLVQDGTIVEWGSKKQTLNLKTKDMRVLQVMDDIMKQCGVPFNAQK